MKFCLYEDLLVLEYSTAESLTSMSSKCVYTTSVELRRDIQLLHSRLDACSRDTATDGVPNDRWNDVNSVGVCLFPFSLLAAP
jgi:hypothetical protein